MTNLLGYCPLGKDYCDNYGYEYLRLRNKYSTMTDWRNENGNN